MVGLSSFGLCLILLLPTSAIAAGGQLRHNFYESSCPSAESVVRLIVEDFYRYDHSVVAGLIRLFFHDCFVRLSRKGCDGSILLDETPSGEPVEKASPGNVGLNGEQVIDVANSFLERLCPGTVSCADILAFASRDAAVVFGIPSYPVAGGRRDGTDSRAEQVGLELPKPFFDAERQTEMFEKKGFSQREMVVLAGAHSIGGAHCSSFQYRLYNHSAGRALDPYIKRTYALHLKQRCPVAGALYSLQPVNPGMKVGFGEEVGQRLDGSYYGGLLRGEGLLESDQALVKERTTRQLVRNMSKHPRKWAQEFAQAMEKLGKVDVLTGDEGEVRKVCRFVN
ncbi:hypothetical protein HPP92_000284 [Vanilla planifolia]|uniref:Peroxidase n=1 Tax=Vanilla planifolia TaxID=51239 RepID=A0A835VIK4_VANPL|nr:hypothetical protein HPP92_000284 [Vanilla planifolia]